LIWGDSEVELDPEYGAKQLTGKVTRTEFLNSSHKTHNYYYSGSGKTMDMTFGIQVSLEERGNIADGH